jgi:hypothetical protein
VNVLASPTARAIPRALQVQPLSPVALSIPQQDDESLVLPVEQGPFVPIHADEDEDDDDNNPVADFEIVGLYSETNGRSCDIHECCGSHVLVGDVIRLKKTVVDVDEGSEESVACVLVRKGRESCTVAFVPHVLQNWGPLLDHINKHAQIVEIYKTSRNTHKRRKSHANLGAAGCCFLDNIPQGE